jgi:hypothetical protein
VKFDQKTIMMTKKNQQQQQLIVICFLLFLVLQDGSLRTAESLIIIERVENQLPTSLTVDCSTVNVDYGVQSVAAGDAWGMTVVSGNVDPTVNCIFKDGGVHGPKGLQIWNYAQSGHSNAPWYHCNPSCSWRVKEEGFYYLSQASGKYVLYSSW